MSYCEVFEQVSNDVVTKGSNGMSEKFVAAIDQGTTSTRCMVFNHAGRVVSVDQKEHEQIFPKAVGRAQRSGDLGEHQAVSAAALGKVI